MKIAILLYEGVTTLDAIGPYDVLVALPGAEVAFVAEKKGEVRTERGFLTLLANEDFDSVKSADVLVVPGSTREKLAVENPRLLAWIREVHATTRFTTSVCTGSIILGAAGVLAGLKATSHWLRTDDLTQYGATPVRARYVEDGRVVTAAGVSAGIDMALFVAARLAGDHVAQSIQLALEYDPQPPFNAGSPEKAPPATVARLRKLLALAQKLKS
jgi:putative intracellular protease/amidase